MKYLCLVYSEERKLDSMPDSECLAYDEALRKSGQCIASALQPVQTATTVWIRNGKVSVTDGRFAETKGTVDWVLSDRRQGPERSHSVSLEHPAGTPRQYRGAADPEVDRPQPRRASAVRGAVRCVQHASHPSRWWSLAERRQAALPCSS
jgi:YCII-related domain